MAKGLIVDFRKKQEAEIEKVVRSILSGQLKSFEDYKAKCAALKAHHRALENFAGAVQKYFDADEELDNLKGEA